MPPKRRAESSHTPRRVTRSNARAQGAQPLSRIAIATTTRSTGRNVPTTIIPEEDAEENEDELNLVSNSADLPKTTRSAPKFRRQLTKQANVVIPIIPKTTRTGTRKRVAREDYVSEQIGYDELEESPRKRRKLASPELEGHSTSSIRSPSPLQTQLSQPTVTVLCSPQKSVAKNLSPLEISTALLSQKRAVLHKLQSIGGGLRESASESENTNDVAVEQVAELLEGSVLRGEGNSCMILGPRGSGKTQIIERCIAALPEPSIVIRLSGWLQYNDRLAIQEIAYQLSQQGATQFSFVADDAHNTLDDEDPFVGDRYQEAATDFSLPVAYLHTLISCIPTLSRPTVLVLDAFDLFTFHPRQSLLYSLLDTVQSCRAGAGNKGMAVVGLTTRMDTLNFFEKRVKSRFSGRMIRTAPPKLSKDWLHIAKDVLLPSAKDYPELKEISAFQAIWQRRVDDFFAHEKAIQIFEETFSLVRDVRVLSRLLTSVVLRLDATSPWLTPALLEKAAETQRIRVPFPQLPNMSYPSLCLLVASVRAEGLGYPALTFEMLYAIVRDEIRGSTSAPVQLNGMSIGMHKVSRSILLCAFEHMVSARIFVVSAAVSVNTAREFVKYRCAVQRVDVDKAVGSNGQHGLKTWWKKVKGS